MNRIDKILTIIFLPLIAAFGIIIFFVSRIRLLIFVSKHNKQVIFFYTNRNNWHDFIETNIFPILPENVKRMCIDKREVKSGIEFKILYGINRSFLFEGTKQVPCFAIMNWPKVEFLSLKEQYKTRKTKELNNNEIRMNIEKMLTATRMK